MTPNTKYDPHYISCFYDDYGEREWERFERSAADRVNFRVHLHHLQRFVKAGDDVLDAGAGPGRFTIELARIGTTVTVVDISPVQLELNRQKLSEAGFEPNVSGRYLADIVDLRQFPDAAFDATVCYGGGLSHVMDQAGNALAELVRVTKPGGYVLVSVMSLVGSAGALLSKFPDLIEGFGRESLDRELETGDLCGPTSRGNRCHMYRWRELEALLSTQDCEIVEKSAANFLAIRNEGILTVFEQNPELYDWFLRWETEYCQEPGAIDGGTHIIAVVRRRDACYRHDSRSSGSVGITE